MSYAGRVLVAAAIVGIRAYRLLVSSWMPGVCRFEPSCSRYAEEALRRYGAWGGFWRGVRRLLRCQPFNSGGFDPLS